MTAPVTDRTLHESLVAALGELSDVAKGETADTGAYSYKYASLAALTGMARPVLAKHGLAISQSVTSQENWLRVSTELIHRSGSVHTSGMLVIEQPRNPQQLGSVVTYLRRYQLLALLGVAAEDDDGAKGAQDTTSTTAPPIRPITTEPTPIRHDKTSRAARIRASLAHYADTPDGQRLILETILARPMKGKRIVDLPGEDIDTLEEVITELDSGHVHIATDDDHLIIIATEGTSE